MRRWGCGSWVVLVLLVAISLGSEAQQVITDVTPETMGRVFKTLEIETEPMLDERGAPVWPFTRRGVVLTIALYDRQSGSRYASMLFYAGWSTSRDVPVSVVNAWNRGARFGRAYVDEEGDPVVEFDLLASGGITEQTIIEAIDVFIDSVLDLDAIIAPYF